MSGLNNLALNIQTTSEFHQQESKLLVNWINKQSASDLGMGYTYQF